MPVGMPTRARVSTGAKGVAALTLVYDHHVRDLTERLTEFQHALGEKVTSTLHVHLAHDHCLEVIVMKGPSTELKRAGDRLLATRGVKHGGMELIALEPAHASKDVRPPKSRVTHAHHHGDGHVHVHEAPAKRSSRKAARARKP